jgi:hypothetical protein
METLYMFEFEEIEPDPPAPISAPTISRRLGGNYVMLNFGTVPQPVNNPDLCSTTCASRAQCGFGLQRSPACRRSLSAGCGRSRPQSATASPATAASTALASAALLLPALNNTEFGLYYLNYHSRLPLLSGIAVTNSNAFSAATSSSTRRTSSSTASAGTPRCRAPASHCRAKSATARTCRCRSTTSNCCSPRSARSTRVIPQPVCASSASSAATRRANTIKGWERHEVSQFQSTFTKAFGPGNFLAADQIALVGEMGATKVWDLPDHSCCATGRRHRYRRRPGLPPARCAIRHADGGFPTQFSWGYRLAGMRADYNNAFGGSFNLSPRIAFNHDVNGITPGPGGNFLEGRKSLTVGVEANYLNEWSFDLSYTALHRSRQFQPDPRPRLRFFHRKYSF